MSNSRKTPNEYGTLDQRLSGNPRINRAPLDFPEGEVEKLEELLGEKMRRNPGSARPVHSLRSI
jgi:hypothetical protein